MNLRLPERGEDAKRIRRAAEGDADAWSDLVDQYSAYVNALLRSARVPEADLADSFQYVFVELFRNLPNLRKTDNLAPWIRQVTLRHAIRTRQRPGGSAVPLDEVGEIAAADALEEDLERAERTRLIHQAIQGLKERCRELIRRLFFTDPPEPYEEVAAALGLGVGSISMTRQRCLEELERALRAKGAI